MSKPITLEPTEYHRTATFGPVLSDWDNVVKEEDEKSVTLLGPVLAGLAVLVFGVGGFFLWASITPVSQASVAHGRVIVQSNTKTVTHLEGGTLHAVSVTEGQHVKEGDLLATFDVTRSQSALTDLQQQLFVIDVRLARLIAEKDERPTFTYTGAIPDVMDREAAEQVISTEQKLFKERQSQFADQIAVDRSSIDQLASQRVALIARRQSWAEQAEFVRRDYETLAGLEKKQLATKLDLNEKKIQLVDMETRVAESDALIAENAQRKSQSELALSSRRTDFFRAVSEQIQETLANKGRAQQQIVAAKDVVAKSAIRSPQEGVVANIKIRTPGSAVLAGQPILDIVPGNQPMLIEGRFRSADIDTIRLNQPADIKLTSFGAAEAFPLIGKVVYIAPDGITDETTGDTGYVFRASIPEEELKKQPNLFLYPGMTAEVYIVNGKRTALAYLAQPIMRSFSKAFREQ
jgi:HlyD family secretion protein